MRVRLGLLSLLCLCIRAQRQPEVFASNDAAPSNIRGYVLSLRHDAANGSNAPQIGLDPQYPPSLPAWLSIKQRFPAQAAPYVSCADLLVQATDEIRRIAPLMRGRVQRLAELNAGIDRANRLISQADACIQKAVEVPVRPPMQGGVTQTQPPSGDVFDSGPLPAYGGGNWPAGVNPRGPDQIDYPDEECRLTPGGRRTIIARGLITIPAGCQFTRQGEYYCIPTAVQSLCPGVSDATVSRLGTERLFTGWLDNRCHIRCRADLFPPAANTPRPPNATPTQPQPSGPPLRICTARDLAANIFARYNTGNPIRILKLTEPRDTYLILLSGTEFRPGQGTDLITDIRQALGKHDPYRLAVLEAANAVIPRGARVILAGHSLGGMVAESIAATPIFQQNYRAQRVITFGSPKVPGADLVGTRYQRFAAVGDPVPNLTLSPDGRPGDHILVRNTLRNPLDSIAKGGPLAAHLAYPDIPDLERYNVGCLDWSMSWDFPVPAL